MRSLLHNVTFCSDNDAERYVKGHALDRTVFLLNGCLNPLKLSKPVKLGPLALRHTRRGATLTSHVFSDKSQIIFTFYLAARIRITRRYAQWGICEAPLESLEGTYSP